MTHLPDPIETPRPVIEQALAVCRDGVLIADAAQAALPIVYANPALCHMSGHGLCELIGSPSAQLLGQELAPQFASVLHAALKTAQRQRQLLRQQRGDGSIGWFELCVEPLPNPVGTLARLVCILTDVSLQGQYQERLTHLSNHDALTGLPNRKQFQERLRHAMAQAGARGDGLAVLYLALDSFNLVNESLGHLAGDQFLQALALRLQEGLREGDVLSRHGGNAFVVILAQASSVQEASWACTRIFRSLAEPFTLAGQHLHAACSVGIARYPADADDAVTLLRYADMALSRARDLGGERIAFFASEMNQRTLDRIQMEAALRMALASGQLQLQYQPMGELQQGQICALEALVRWQHPVLGLINASRFIPLAEAAGLTTAIGYWSLQRACQDMRAWQDAGLPPIPVAVNISPKQFRDAGLAQAVAGALEHAGLEPQRLALEITEAALMQDAQASFETLAQLKALGIGITLDDFGTGYSSLNHLKRFPLDLVKIDCALIGNVVSGTDDAVLVKTIIAMAHHLGIEVAAEGVETEAQCDFLRRNMCDQIQGYFLSAPCEPAEIAIKLAERQALPQHLLRIQKQKRTLLLVDDEQNIVSALKRLLRRDDYQILTAHSGQQGLDVLALNPVDVIVSDQRMPGMIGADFLRAAKQLYPDTIRIMLSGYTELQSVTDAVNEGAIYKFLTKPWDDEQLRGHIADAFRLKEIADDNERLNLELRTANQELASTNRRMAELLSQKQQQITRDEISLNVARELLQFMPLAVIGLDDEGMVAFVNAAAETLFAGRGSVLGSEAAIVLPDLFPDGQAGFGSHHASILGRRYQIVVHSMGEHSASRGSLITISHCEEA